MDFQEVYAKGNEALKQKQYDDARKYFEEAIKLKLLYQEEMIYL